MGCALPELQGIKAAVRSFLCSVVPAAAPPTSPLMALLIAPLAVSAKAPFPRCFFGLRLHFLFPYVADQCAADPKFSRWDRALLLFAATVDAASVLHFCQIRLGPPPAIFVTFSDMSRTGPLGPGLSSVGSPGRTDWEPSRSLSLVECSWWVLSDLVKELQ